MTTSSGGTTATVAPYDIGDEVQDLSLPVIGGGMGSLSEYRGKTVLLVFTATWCPYCGAEAPYLEEIWQRFKDRGVQVIVIDVKEAPAAMESFRDHHGWTFPVWLDETGELGLKFAPHKEGLPPEVAVINAHFLIDDTGRVRYRDYLNMERFDARATTVIEEIERLLEARS